MHLTGREVRKAVKVIDGTLNDYLERLDRWTSQEGWLTSLAKIEASDKFRDGVAQPMPGCTLITPTHRESARCQSVYQELSIARAAILDMIGMRCNSVPKDCLHVTAADLISGDHFETRRTDDPSLETRLRERIHSLLLAQPRVESPLAWQVSGLAFFQHALVAVLAPLSEQDYEPIRDVRRCIYNDETMRRLGGKKPWPFLAHVTLAYYDHIPSIEVRRAWVSQYAALQAEVKRIDQTFVIERLDLRWFRDMTAYHPYTPNIGLSFG